MILLTDQYSKQQIYGKQVENRDKRNNLQILLFDIL